MLASLKIQYCHLELHFSKVSQKSFYLETLLTKMFPLKEQKRYGIVF